MLFSRHVLLLILLLFVLLSKYLIY